MRDTSKWTGIIGLYLGGKMYVDLSEDLNDSNLNKGMGMLCKELQRIGIAPTMKGKPNISIGVRARGLGGFSPPNPTIL